MPGVYVIHGGVASRRDRPDIAAGGSTPTPTYPYPVVSLASITVGGDTFNQAVARLTTPTIVTVPAGTYTTNDFTVAGLYGFGATNLAGIIGAKDGSGNPATKFQINANTSTKGATVAALGAGTTNQFYILNIGQSTTLTTLSPWFENIWIQGTTQGHIYGGIREYNSINATITNVWYYSIPGDDSIPPGETFAHNSYKSNGATFTDCKVEGGGISASQFATNSSSNTTYIRCQSNNTGVAAAWAFYQQVNITMVDCSSNISGNRDLNFERVTGTINVTRHHFISSDPIPTAIGTDVGSGTYTFVPYPGTTGIPIRIFPSYNKNPSTQIVGNVQGSPSSAYVITVH